MSYQSINPFNNQKLKDYPSHTDQDIQNALDTAEKILKSDWIQQVDTGLRYFVNWQTICGNVSQNWLKS